MNDERAAHERVLVVEDEVELAAVVASYLVEAGFDVSQAYSGVAALELVQELEPDVVVLDLGLPGLDGIEVCRRIRTFSDCYVLMLTARSDEIDKLIGLSVGADDYITKPFSPRELVARVQVLLRRPRRLAGSGEPPTPDTGERFGLLTVDRHSREVFLGDTLVELTRTEFDILAALVRSPRQAFSRGQIIDEVWGVGWVGDEHVVDVHVAHVRQKLDDDPLTPRFIETVRGVGYRMGKG